MFVICCSLSFVVCYVLYDGCCLLFVVRGPLRVACRCLLSGIRFMVVVVVCCCLLCVIGCLLLLCDVCLLFFFIVCCLVYDGHGLLFLLFVTCRVMVVVCCLLLVVGC